MTYSTSIIPVIVSAFFAAKLEKFLNTIIPDVIKMFIVPLLKLLIVLPLTFILIGPIATWVDMLLVSAAVTVYNLSPFVAGLFLRGFW